MKLLLDANVVVWVLSDPGRIKPDVVKALCENQTFVSSGSLLELTSKAASGRLVFSQQMRDDLADLCDWLPVTADHAFLVQHLPPIHRDPFDRIIIAQAMLENMTLVTGDRLLADYGVPILLT